MKLGSTKQNDHKFLVNKFDVQISKIDWVIKKHEFFIIRHQFTSRGKNVPKFRITFFKNHESFIKRYLKKYRRYVLWIMDINDQNKMLILNYNAFRCSVTAVSHHISITSHHYHITSVSYQNSITSNQ